MKEVLQEIMGDFQTSSGLTPQFDEFQRKFRRRFRSFLRKLGATDIKMSRNHFIVNGNFTIDGQAYYFSTGDVRNITERGVSDSMLVRTVEDYGDHRGGHNRYVKYAGYDFMYSGDTFEERFKSAVEYR